jgi:hypothetical protein
VRRGIVAVIAIVYLVVGLVVAQTEGYLRNLSNLKPLLSALLAILLWPLVLVGVELKFGQP